MQEDNSQVSAQTATDDAQASPQPEQPANQVPREWFVIHTYSGYEQKVKTNLEHRIKTMDMLDKIFQVVIPVEDEVEVRDGQRRTV